MHDTTTAASGSTFDVAARSHLDRLCNAYEAGGLGWSWDNPDAVLRVDATRAQRFVFSHSVGGTLGFLAGLGVLLLGVRYADLVNSTDSSQGPFLGALLGAAVWGFGAWAGHRFTRSGVQQLSHDTAGFLTVFNDAVHELRQAADRGADGASAAVEAADAMRPGLEELLDEHRTLEQAVRANRYAMYRADYRDALLEQKVSVTLVILTVCAEVSAAAGIMFASRPDLLVELASADTTAVQLRTSALTEAGQSALAEARRVLAAAVDQR